MRRIDACILLSCLVCTCFIQGAVAREEIAAFRLTDFDAFIQSRTEYYQTRIESADSETVVQTPHYFEDLGGSLRGFIYHPNLLKFDISGNISVNGQDTSRETTSSSGRSESGSTRTSVFWALDANIALLQRKPYPLTLFYSRQNPLATTGLEGEFTQENESYGFNFALIDVMPMNLFLRARRSSSNGESLDRIIDSIYDRIFMKLFGNFSSTSQVTLDYELTHQVSRNGNPNRQIRETDTLAQVARLTSRFQFGSRDQFRFYENANFNWRNDPNYLSAQVAPKLGWSLNEQLHLESRYNYFWSDRPEEGLKTERQGASVLVRYQPLDKLFVHAGVRGDTSDEAQGFRQQSYGGFLSANYSRDIPFGTLNIIPKLDYTYHQRDTSTPQISILDESLQLSATTPVLLLREFVIPSTVVVQNADRTQTYILDVDYRLIEVGNRIEIQRLATGTILEGESVIVDYDVLTGGAIDFSVLKYSLNLNASLARYYQLYLRYQESRQKLESGIAVLPLNSVRFVEVGARGDVPLRWRGIYVGGEATYRIQDEDINPYDQINLEAYIQLPLPKRISMRLSAYQTMTSTRNSDDRRTALMANLNWRSRRNLAITAFARYEVGSGQALERSRMDASIRAIWRYRKLSLNAEIRYEKETQERFGRDNLRAILLLRRELW